ncbi:hypothetical protein MLD38_034367 [Melastoma candidum]|uniref:Uncharacterized protein n=1 Tax=Melastoma candidum TaxID=119954 RepID=A0ACB9M9U9_9MYRT|nr:hypothetical protein MLD38_034367 [Melastoma candidum]
MNPAPNLATSELFPRDSSVAPGDRTSVNQEYAEAFRTESFAEMWGKLAESRVTASTSLDRPVPPFALLSESLLQPARETLVDMAKSFYLHPLLIEYFDVTSKACDVYELLLNAVHSTQANFQKVKAAIILVREEFDENSSCLENRTHEKICGELSSYAQLQNSLSVVSMDQFRDLHDGHSVLLRNLVNEHRQMNKRRKLSEVCKKISECARLGRRTNNLRCSRLCDSSSSIIRPPRQPAASHGEDLDMAAKLLYIQINDMDTVSRLVGRLEDDAIRGKSQASMAAECDTGDVWEGIVMRLGNEGVGFMEQLEELEQRICLCLLTINKSRLSVVHEITNDRN